jgi:ribosomal protein S13
MLTNKIISTNIRSNGFCIRTKTTHRHTCKVQVKGQDRKANSRDTKRSIFKILEEKHGFTVQSDIHIFICVSRV